MQCLKDIHLDTTSSQIPSHGQRRRSRTDAGNLKVLALQGAGGQISHFLTGRFCGIRVGHVPLQPPNSHWLIFLAENALTFTLGLLRTDSTADRRQGVGLANNAIGTTKVIIHQMGNKTLDIDIDRTTFLTERFFALQTPPGFNEGLFTRITKGYFVKILPALNRVLMRHGCPSADCLLLIFRHCTDTPC